MFCFKYYLMLLIFKYRIVKVDDYLFKQFIDIAQLFTKDIGHKLQAYSLLKVYKKLLEENGEICLEKVLPHMINKNY